MAYDWAIPRRLNLLRIALLQQVHAKNKTLPMVSIISVANTPTNATSERDHLKNFIGTGPLFRHSPKELAHDPAIVKLFE